MSKAHAVKEWSIPSLYGGEKVMMREVASLIARLNPAETRIDDITTAIAEACLNAIEHGNGFAADLPVTLHLTVDEEKYAFRVFDHGTEVPVMPPEPRLTDKWQADKPRGWGLYLINRLADQVEFGKMDEKVYVDIIFLR